MPVQRMTRATVTAVPQIDLAADSVLGETRLIPLSPEEGAAGGARQPARALALTQFHALWLQPGRARAACVLDQRPVLEDPAAEVG